MENMSGVANGVFILPKPSPGSGKKLTVLGDKNGRLGSGLKKYPGKTPPLKPPKKQRSPGDDTEILRCKRKIHFQAGKLGLQQQRNPKQMQKRNERERNRVRTINSTFETLQEYLPPGYIEPKPKNKKMSKVEVLKATIDYIRNLQEVLTESDHMMAQHGHMLPLNHHHHHQQNGLIMVSQGMDMMSPPMINTNNSMMTSPNMPPLQSQGYPPQQQMHQPMSDMHVNTGYYNSFPSGMQQQGSRVVTMETCSPNSEYSHSSAETSPVGYSQPQQGGGVKTSPYSDGPLTPEEEIIMEWLHDQRT